MTDRWVRTAAWFLLCAPLGAIPIASAQAPATGRVVLTLGVCKEALVDRPVLLFRDRAKNEHRRLSPNFLGPFDYEDATGGYSVIVRDFPAGDWEFYNHEMTSKYAGSTYRHQSRFDYSLPFKVEPGKLVDLGRFCAASQATGETFEHSPNEVFNTRVHNAYFVISASRPEDVERARKVEGTPAPLEVVAARPPGSPARPFLHERILEPRMIRKPPAPTPMEIPR